MRLKVEHCLLDPQMYSRKIIQDCVSLKDCFTIPEGTEVFVGCLMDVS